MKSKRNRLITIILTSLVILLPTLFGLIIWDKLPEKMVTHWGISGEPDGWSSKAFTVIGIPLLLLVMHIICVLATSIDKKHEQNKTVLSLVLWIIPIVSVICFSAIYCHSFDISYNVSMILPASMGILFIIIGNYLPKCKQNYFIGIKLPWTYMDENNWYVTHRLGGKTFVIGGILTFLCVFVPSPISSYIQIAILVAVVLIPTIYSYVYYIKNNK